MLQHFASWLNDHMVPCLFKRLFGVECPTCGMQRAFVELVQGNVAASLSYHWALIPTLGLFAFLGLHLLFSFKHGAAIIKWLFIIDVVVIAVNFVFN